MAQSLVGYYTETYREKIEAVETELPVATQVIERSTNRVISRSYSSYELDDKNYRVKYVPGKVSGYEKPHEGAFQVQQDFIEKKQTSQNDWGPQDAKTELKLKDNFQTWQITKTVNNLTTIYPDNKVGFIKWELDNSAENQQSRMGSAEVIDGIYLNCEFFILSTQHKDKEKEFSPSDSLKITADIPKNIWGIQLITKPEDGSVYFLTNNGQKTYLDGTKQVVVTNKLHLERTCEGKGSFEINLLGEEWNQRLEFVDQEHVGWKETPEPSSVSDIKPPEGDFSQIDFNDSSVVVDRSGSSDENDLVIRNDDEEAISQEQLEEKADEKSSETSAVSTSYETMNNSSDIYNRGVISVTKVKELNKRTSPRELREDLENYKEQAELDINQVQSDLDDHKAYITDKVEEFEENIDSVSTELENHKTSISDQFAEVNTEIEDLDSRLSNEEESKGSINVSGKQSAEDTEDTTYTISELKFDDQSGLFIEEQTEGTVEVFLGSHFKTIQVEGEEDIVAEGEDTLNLDVGTGLLLSTDASTNTISIEIDNSPAEVTSFTFDPETYPENQSELKEGDSIEVVIEANKPFDEVYIPESSVFSEQEETLSEESDNLRLTLSVKGQPQGEYSAEVSVRASSNKKWSSEKTSDNTINLNNQYPKFTLNSINYPSGQSAVKDNEQVEVDFSIEEYDEISATADDFNITTVTENIVKADLLDSGHSEKESDIKFSLTKQSNQAITETNTSISIAHQEADWKKVPKKTLRTDTSTETKTFNLNFDREAIEVELDGTFPVGNFNGISGSGKTWSLELEVSDSDDHSSTYKDFSIKVTNAARKESTLTGEVRIKGFHPRDYTIDTNETLTVDLGVTVINENDLVVSSEEPPFNYTLVSSFSNSGSEDEFRFIGNNKIEFSEDLKSFLTGNSPPGSLTCTVEEL